MAPSSAPARLMRVAISPRLAARIFLKGGFRVGTQTSSSIATELLKRAVKGALPLLKTDEDDANAMR